MARPRPGLDAVTIAARPVMWPMASLPLTVETRPLPAPPAGAHNRAIREPRMQYNRISADCHLDLPWMPPDLFTSMAPRDMKERMPYVVETEEGPKWTSKNAANFGFKNGVSPGGGKY